MDSPWVSERWQTTYTQDSASEEQRNRCLRQEAGNQKGGPSLSVIPLVKSMRYFGSSD
jgi:hypothetical protein